MNEQQEVNMRSQVSEYGHSHLIDLVIDLQKTIETHVNEKSGFKSSINSLDIQNEALQRENDRLESESTGCPVDTGDLAALEERIALLQSLNEKLQRKLLDEVVA